jgi:hypothetical protein
MRNDETRALLVAGLATALFITYLVKVIALYIQCDGLVVQAMRWPGYACVAVQP